MGSGYIAATGAYHALIELGCGQDEKDLLSRCLQAAADTVVTVCAPFVIVSEECA